MLAGYLHEIYEHLRLSRTQTRQSPQSIEVAGFSFGCGGRLCSRPYKKHSDDSHLSLKAFAALILAALHVIILARVNDPWAAIRINIHVISG